jgi:predicted alpha/beta-fold hydrolase
MGQCTWFYVLCALDGKCLVIILGVLLVAMHQGRGSVLVWLLLLIMHRISRRKWRILCWNVRGLNSDNTQREVRSKIDESDRDVICLQETKCESFDWRFLWDFLS